MAVWSDEILRISAELMNCVRKHDTAGARCLVFDITEKEDTKFIVAKRDDRNALLFEAARRGNAEMVRILVSECYADLEERGEYGGHGLVTPLWCAAATNRLDVVESLIEFGADVNAVSARGCTPVLSACALRYPKVDDCLICHGADVKKRSEIGQTCLMKAVKFKELSQLLIDNGADVLAQDKSGCQALHYAIKKNQPDTMQLLLDHGSDPYVKNKAGDDAFRTASLKGCELILKELLFKFKPPVQHFIESYQLLGGYYADFGNCINKAINVWKDAVVVQQKKSSVEIISSKPNPVYLFAQEVNTVEELEALARNRESVEMYALMIRERILGPNHDHTIKGLLNRGRVYRYKLETRRCMDIWKYALHLQNSSGFGQLNDQYLQNIHDLCCWFCELYGVGRRFSHRVDQLIMIKDSLEILEMATAMLELTVGNKFAEKNSEKETDFLNLILLIIKFITELDSNAFRECSVRKIVYRLVRCQSRTEQGQTLLHLSILPSTYGSLFIKFILEFPSIAVVELLLECGPTSTPSMMETTQPCIYVRKLFGI